MRVQARSHGGGLAHLKHKAMKTSAHQLQSDDSRHLAGEHDGRCLSGGGVDEKQGQETDYLSDIYQVAQTQLHMNDGRVPNVPDEIKDVFKDTTSCCVRTKSPPPTHTHLLSEMLPCLQTFLLSHFRWFQRFMSFGLVVFWGLQTSPQGAAAVLRCVSCIFLSTLRLRYLLLKSFLSVSR